LVASFVPLSRHQIITYLEHLNYVVLSPLENFLINYKPWWAVRRKDWTMDIEFSCAMEEDGTVASIISLKVLSSEMDPAEIRLIR
jgi:hypothetical protein